MASPSPLYTQSESKPGRRPRRAEEGEELGKKPKKINSEVRKQQNRIASRNYREKRKRKLQYLQQLIKDGSDDEQTSDTSPRQHDAHLRSLSADYDAGPSSSPYLLPSHSEYAPMSSNGSVAMGPSSTATTASFDHHLLPSTQSFSPYSSSWNSPIYDPPPPTNMTWTVPAWMPTVDYSPRVAPRSENFHYSPPLGAGHPTFEKTPSPYSHARDLAPNAEHYTLGSSYGHYDGSQNHTPAIPSYFYGASQSQERAIYI